MLSDFNPEDKNESSRPEKRLTVVIPHFNHKDFLPRAVASILNGETRGIEIIIVDDGSTAMAYCLRALRKQCHH